jgi:hypothetical protein
VSPVPSPTAGRVRPQREWPVGSCMRPGAKGTRRLLRVYGAQLLCVRYRYDERGRRRITTVELKVDEQPCRPKALALVHVEIRYAEARLQELVKKTGATWDRARGLWRMRRSAAIKLGLGHRIRQDEVRSTT